MLRWLRTRLRLYATRLRFNPFVNSVLPWVGDRLRSYGLLMRVDRPIGTFLLLWPALWALWISGAGHPDPKVFTIFVAGVFVMRSAGCVINDFADRRIDPHVTRTRNRPLATGAVRPFEAILLFIALLGVALWLVLQLDLFTVGLAAVGALFTAAYPFTKRVSSVPQLYLGLAFAWSVPMAWAAQTGDVPNIAWTLFGAVVLWTAAYDTMYAMVDRPDDVRIGVKSTAILFGQTDRVAVGIMQVCFFGAMILVGRLAGLGLWFGIGLTAAAVYATWQQYLIRERHPPDCFRAFLSNHGLGTVVFCGILLDYTFAA